MADEERQIKRARLIGPKNYKTVWQKMHYEEAQERQRAREEADAKAVRNKPAVTPTTVFGAPRPEFGPPAVVRDGDFIDQRPLLPPMRAVTSQARPGAVHANPDRWIMEQKGREGPKLVATRGKAIRTPEGWEIPVDAQPWRGVPYPLEPAVGHFVEERPYNLLEQAQQCWTDRGSLDVRDVDMATAAEAGVKRAFKSAASGAAKAGAVGWLGGGAEFPAIAIGAAGGGAGGFAQGAAWSAVKQMCRPKMGNR